MAYGKKSNFEGANVGRSMHPRRGGRVTGRLTPHLQSGIRNKTTNRNIQQERLSYWPRHQILDAGRTADHAGEHDIVTPNSAVSRDAYFCALSYYADRHEIAMYLRPQLRCSLSIVEASELL